MRVIQPINKWLNTAGAPIKATTVDEEYTGPITPLAPVTVKAKIKKPAEKDGFSFTKILLFALAGVILISCVSKQN